MEEHKGGTGVQAGGVRNESGAGKGLLHVHTSPGRARPHFPLFPPQSAVKAVLICTTPSNSLHGPPFLYLSQPPWSHFPLHICNSNVVYSVSPGSRVTSSMKSYLIWSNFSLPLFILYTSTLMIHIPLFVYLPHSPFVFIICEAASSLVPAGAGLEFYPFTPKLASSGVGWRQY